MKAFIYERYGPPETLRMAEVDKPSPEAGEVLVKVLAVSVNAADWHVLRGKPLFSRATLGLLRPKHQILGVDVAGQVEAVGGGVTGFKAGDEVYANLLDHGYGGFADYVSVPADAMSLKPPSLSFEEAAAVPMAAVTALQGLRRHGEHPIRPAGPDQWRFGWGRQLRRPTRHGLRGRGDGRDQHLATWSWSVRWAPITSSTTPPPTPSGVGGAMTASWTRSGTGRSSDLRGGLASGGKAAVTGFTSVAKLLGVSLRGGKDVAMVQAHVTAKDLEVLSELVAAGKVHPQIDRRYRFAELPAAIAYLEQGRARGKVVVEVA